MGNKRFIIRREYFGGIIYDKEKFKYYFIDNNAFDLLKKLYGNLSLNKKQEKNKNVFEKLYTLGFFNFDCTKISYEFLENEVNENILSAPLQVYYDFTDKCFLNCKHCYAIGNYTKERLLTLEETDKFSQSLKDCGVFKISLGGGEPLYTENWPDIINCFRKKGLDVSLSTNGLLLQKKENIDLLNQLALRTISISCEGGKEETFDYIRGKGTFQKLLEALKMVQKYYKYRYSLRVTITSYTANEIKEIIDLAKNFGFHSVKFKYLQLYGNANNHSDLLPSKEKYNEAIDIALEYGEKKNIKIAVPRHYAVKRGKENVVNDYDHITENDLFPVKWGFQCSGGSIGLYVTQYGYITPCVSLGNKFWSGNIRWDNLLDVWENGKGFCIMRNLKGNEPCLSCEHLNFCKGGCRVRALQLTQSLQQPDPYCSLVE